MAVAQAAGEIQQLSQRRPELDLVDAGSGDVAADAEQLRPGGALRPERPVGVGATLGSGVVMAFDETADIVGTLRRIAEFFRDESCGQCVPCRVGTVRQEELLARLATANLNGSRADELALLGEIGQAMRDASICGLGQTASSAIESALRQPELVAL